MPSSARKTPVIAVSPQAALSIKPVKSAASVKRLRAVEPAKPAKAAKAAKETAKAAKTTAKPAKAAKPVKAAKIGHVEPKSAKPARAELGATEKETDYDLVDVDSGGSGGDAADSTDEELAGSYNWLLDSLDDSGGWPADWSDNPVDHQADSGEPLDVAAQLDHSALTYGSGEDGGRYERLRRLTSDKTLQSVEDHFGGDEDAVFLALTARKVITAALVDGDPWSYEWIFGAVELKTESIPPRSMVLEYFDAREVVFQTRVQYQMLRDNRTTCMKFLAKGLDRVFLWQLSTLLREQGQMMALDHALTIMEQMWRNPGVRDDALWKLYVKHIAARPGQAQHEPDKALFETILVFLDLAYMITRNDKVGGWYLTGKNPTRQIEDMRRDLKNYNVATMTRGWSSWW